MKTYNNLFVETASLESLLNAWDEFKMGKRHKPDVQIFERHLEDNLFALHDEFVAKKYRHGPYASFYIKDPKLRLIHKSSVRDRIVHHAVFKKLNNIFEPTFVFDSYSCREKKGAHRAVRRLRSFAHGIDQKFGRCFVLKCDIKKFFHSIDHKILFDLISWRIKDSEMLRLVKELIESFPTAVSDRERERESKGCPIGNLTSQLFANIYLNELDQFIKHNLKVKWYIRYTDDFVIAHPDVEYLLTLKCEIEEFLRARLGMELHPDKVSLRKYSQGIDFLGYVVLPHAQVLRTKTKRRIFKKLGYKVLEFKNGEITEEQLFQSIHSYLGVLSHAKSYQLKQEIMHMVWSSLKSPDLT